MLRRRGSIVFTGRNYSLINYDTWNPNNDIYRSQTYNNLYKGIREANYFMQHVFECPEMSEIDKGYHYNEARFLRAWFYYCLLRQYGPCVLLGDEVLPGDLDRDDVKMNLPRSSHDECVDYIVGNWTT